MPQAASPRPPSLSALLAASVALVAAIPLLQLHPSTAARLDACHIQRGTERPPATRIPLGDTLLHNLSVYVMWASMLTLCLLPRRRVAGLFALALASLWFHVTYVALAALKAPLADLNCAGRHAKFPNGISGHYCYFVFVALTAPLLASQRLRANPDASRVVLAVAAALLFLFAVGGFATLYRTFFHGYHSPRQILLGAALGVASHLGLRVLYLTPTLARTVGQTLGVVAGLSLVSIAMYVYLWPHVETVPALSAGQFKLHAALWVIVLALSARLQDDVTKEASD